MAEIDCLQTNIWWIPSVQKWVTSTLTFVISSWTFSRNAEKKIEEKNYFQAHIDKITGVVDLSGLEYVATCS